MDISASEVSVVSAGVVDLLAQAAEIDSYSPVHVQGGAMSVDNNGDAAVTAFGLLQMSARSSTTKLATAEGMIGNDVTINAGAQAVVKGRSADFNFASDISVVGGDMRVEGRDVLAAVAKLSLIHI